MLADRQHGRAGQRVMQPTGYRAFEPAPLPPDPPVVIDQELQTLLSNADRALGRLDGSIQTLPDADLFVFMYVRAEAVYSSQIEGTQSSLTDVLEAEAAILDPARPADVREVLNYVAAMHRGLELLETLPISVRLMREIHAVLLAGVRGAERQPGEVRTSQNWIGPSGSSLNEAVFVPPPPSLVPGALSKLEEFLHDDDPMPALLKIGLAHAQLETIHPFLDGNGRLGRLLITFLLCEQGILQSPVLYLSHYFRRHQAAYYERLQAIRDEGDWEGWLRFFLEGVDAVAGEATTSARAIVGLRERDRQRVMDAFGRGTANALTTLEHLFTQPIIRTKEIREWTGLSYAAASQIVSRFVEIGVLEEITGNIRNRRFQYSEYVALFADQ